MANKKTILIWLYLVLAIMASACRTSSSSTQLAAPSPDLLEPHTRTISPQPTRTETANITRTPSPTPTGTPAKTPTNNLPVTHPPVSTPTAPQDNQAGLIVTLGERVAPPWYSGVSVFSPDGKIIALATARIRFWDVETHTLIREFNNPFPENCYVSHAAFSSDGSLFAISCWGNFTDQGYLRVWDFETGNLLQEWILEFAHMVEPHHAPYGIPIDAFAFIPGAPQIAYATGNQVVIRDVRSNHEPAIELALGTDMFASELSIRADGRFLFALMVWDKLNTFPSSYSTQYKVQIWQLETETISRVLDYPEYDYAHEYYSLHGESILHQDWVNGTFEVHNLSTDEITPFPYRHGWKYFNSDLSLMVCARLFGYHPEEQIIELWDTDRWRNIYSFLPYFGRDWTYGMHMITFSPDSTILAIEHQEQVSLWNIQPIVQP